MCHVKEDKAGKDLEGYGGRELTDPPPPLLTAL